MLIMDPQWKAALFGKISISPIAFFFLTAALLIQCTFSFTGTFQNRFFQCHQYRQETSANTKVMMSKGFNPMYSFKYTGRRRPGIIGALRKVPDNILKPDYIAAGKVPSDSKTIVCHNEEAIRIMREGGRIARHVLDTAVSLVRPGITTDEIDDLVHKECIRHGAYPSPLLYRGFPKSCCTSVNEVMCHGIPDSQILQNGDLINIDITIFYQGFHSDCSETVLVQNRSSRRKDISTDASSSCSSSSSSSSKSKQSHELLLAAHGAWRAAINHCKPGVRYSEVGGIIDNYLSSNHGDKFVSARHFCGHGIGKVFHDVPNVFHVRNNIDQGIMQVGHIFTVEPIICEDSDKSITWPDGWTEACANGKPSAQFENTLLVVDGGVEELTGKLPTSPAYSWL